MSVASTQPSDKRAIFVCSQKGGAGKSTFARALVEVLRERQFRVAALDGDGDVGQLLQYEGTRDSNDRLLEGQDPLVGCGEFDIRREDDRDMLVNVLMLNAERIVIDLPGGTLRELGDVLEDGGSPRSLIDEYRRVGYAVTIVVVMTPVLASIRSLKHAIKAFDNSVNYVAVKNLAFGNSDDFVLYDGLSQEEAADGESPVQPCGGKAALAKQRGKLIKMPPLKARSYAMLDLNSFRFVDAIDEETLPYVDRRRIGQWLERFVQSLAPAADTLGLTPVQQETQASAAGTISPSVARDTSQNGSIDNATASTAEPPPTVAHDKPSRSASRPSPRDKTAANTASSRPRHTRHH